MPNSFHAAADMEKETPNQLVARLQRESGLSIEAWSRAIGFSGKQAGRVIKGKCGIGKHVAKKLSDYYGIPQGRFLDLDNGGSESAANMNDLQLAIRVVECDSGAMSSTEKEALTNAAAKIRSTFGDVSVERMIGMLKDELDRLRKDHIERAAGPPRKQKTSGNAA